ncbi:MAG: hypothetical protein ACD_80C00102G0006 [uncultured bacterium (gcode 4)]|uniref:Uncharacterized protein n=1 Tax=uncultured bacterium (gcode 4) TaxID=1234023 RepID=K1YIM0_9BACT|nr:MAG: hypothetical protein ACD_80C00102G0006 [uncultured bacterium (gcode 4)]
MKKIGIVLSIAIITWVFIFTMSFVSSNNVCTWVRIYECTALQQKQAAAQLAQQQLEAQQAQQQILTQQQAQAAALLQAQQQAIQQQAAQQQAPQQTVQTKINTRTRAS